MPMTRRERPERASRRRFLALGAAGAISGLGGCVLSQDGGTGASPNETSESTISGDDRDGCAESRSGGNENVDRANRWPQFRADARNSGANLAATGPTLDGDGVTADADRIFELQGIIQNPCVYGDTIVFSTSERTHAIGARGGDDRWTIPASESSNTTQVATPEFVVRKMWDVIEVRDLATGCRQSRMRLDMDLDDLLLAGSAILGRSNDHGVVNISVPDISVNWEFSRAGMEYDQVVADEERVYVGTGAGELFALDLEGGSELWHVGSDRGLEFGLLDYPVVDENHIYTQTTGDSLVALATADGTERWRSPADVTVTTSPAVTPDGLYIGIDAGAMGARSRGGGILALDPDDGSELWRQETLRSDVTEAPVIAGNGLYVAEDGTFELLDTGTGSVEATIDLEHGNGASDLVVTDGLAHVIVGYGHTHTDAARADQGRRVTSTTFLVFRTDRPATLTASIPGPARVVH